VGEHTEDGSSSSGYNGDATDVAVAGGEAVAPTRQKRNSTPLAQKKRPKRVKLGASFEQAEKDDLLGVILNRNDPYKLLSRELIMELRRLLIERLEGTLNNPDGFIPCFQESGVRANRFPLSCANTESYEWLQATVQSLCIPDGDSQLLLTLAKPAEVRKLMRAEVYLHGTPLGAPKFLWLLAGQNRGLHVKRWTVCHQQTTANGQLLVLALTSIRRHPFWPPTIKPMSGWAA